MENQSNPSHAFSGISPYQFGANSQPSNYYPLAWTSQFLQQTNHYGVEKGQGLPFDDILKTLSELAEAGASEETLSKVVNQTQEQPTSEEELFNVTGIYLPTLQGLLNDFGQPSTHKEEEKKPIEIGLSDVFRWDQHLMTQLSPQLAQQLPQQFQPTMVALQSPQSLNPEFIQQLQKAYQKYQPVRVSVSNDVSVILKFSPNGQLSASFLASSPQVSLLLKEQLSHLQQHLQSKALPFVQLSVKDQQQQNHQQQKQQQF